MSISLHGLALAALLSSLAGPGLAQTAQAPLDPSIVDACLAATPRGGVDPDCIGQAARACQEIPGYASTVGASACLMAEHDAWDRILNDQYREAAALLGGPLQVGDQLRTAQRAWIAFRDADCTLAYDRYGGGSMRVIASADCQMRHTARRALELRDMRGE